MARSFVAASSQDISVASNTAINFGSGDFTVLAWVRFPTPPPNAAMVVGKRAGGFDGDAGWELKTNDGGNGSYRWDVETDATGRQRAEATLTGINDGNWHLIGGDHTDGTPSQLQLWYDGAVAATKVAATPGTVDTVTPMVIGAAYNTPNSNFLTGYVGPVFTFKRILTLAEHQMMAAGFSPRFLRPLPSFLMELARRGSPELDLIAGLQGILENAPAVVDNPRIVYPVAPAPGQDLWYEFANATIAAQSSVDATQTRGRTASASIDSQSTVTVAETVLASVAATISAQSSVAAGITPDAPLRANLLAQSDVTATVNINAGVGARPKAKSNVIATASARVPVSTTVAAQSAIAARLSADVPVAASLVAQSALSVSATRGRTVSASIPGQSSLSATAVHIASAFAQISGQSSLSANLSATVPLSTTIAAVSGMVADASVIVPLSAAISVASGITATVTRGRVVNAAIAGQSSLTADTRALAPLQAAISAQSDITAIASARVSARATVGAQSNLVARLTFPGVERTTSVGGTARWLQTVGGRITR